MDSIFVEVFMSLWLLCCFMCFGLSFYTLTEGTFWTFLLSLLLVPFGPITIAYQWAMFHGVTNKNLYLLANVINNNFEQLNNSEKGGHGKTAGV